MTKKSFLVLSGGNDRAVLAFLRTIRLCGRQAHIVARTEDDRILRTAFRRDVRWVRPTHQLDLDIFSDCIRRVRHHTGDKALVILPSTEYLNAFLLRHRHEITMMGCEIPLANANLYTQLTEKRSATNIFAETGLRIPKELHPPYAHDQPVVAKPIRNVSSEGHSLYPHLLYTQTQITSFMDTYESRDYFFQEFVEGSSVYLLFYLSNADDSEFIWSQRNLLQQPDGKSMLLAEPDTFHETTAAAAVLRKLRAIGFHGLGMVEIIQTKDDNYFIEMNPRIWGPVQFCIDQHQPLLQAFIGDVLHDEPARYLDSNTRWRRSHYFWASGILDTIRSGRRPDWHGAQRNLLTTVITKLGSDIYLRKDSWRCVLHDLTHQLRTGS